MDAIDDMLHELLTDLPCGEFLIEHHGEVRVLWRISEGEPLDGALDPAPAGGCCQPDQAK